MTKIYVLSDTGASAAEAGNSFSSLRLSAKSDCSHLNVSFDALWFSLTEAAFLTTRPRVASISVKDFTIYVSGSLEIRGCEVIAEQELCVSWRNYT